MKTPPQATDNPSPKAHAALPGRDPLFWMILAAAIGLGGLTALLYQTWGTGQVLGENSWYIPMTHSIAGLAAFCVAFLAFGRYPVLGDATSLWIGLGFAAFGLQTVFYILAWPGLLPDGRGVLARLPGTSGWIALLELATLGAALLAAGWNRWPRRAPGQPGPSSTRWGWWVAAGLAGMVGLCSLVVAFEAYLPPLVDGRGRLAPLILGIGWVLLFLNGLGVVLATVRYWRTGDTLLGYVALAQLAVGYVILMTLIGGERYDTWFYLSRLVMIGGFLTLLFGLLANVRSLLRRERDLWEVNRRHKALLDSISEADPGGMAVVAGPELRFVYTNLTYRLLTPDPRLDPLGQPYQRVWTAGGGDVYREAIAETLRSGKPFFHNGIVHTFPDGSQRFFALQVRRLAWGDELAALVILWDVTELKQSEQSLQASESRYRRLVETANEGIWTIDAHNRTEMINPHGARILGYTPAEMLGRPALEFVFPEDVPQSSQVLEARKAGLAEQRTVRMRHQDGHAVWAHSASTPIYGEGGEYLGALAMFVDITERKQAEEALHEREEMLRLALRAGQAGAWSWDLTTHTVHWSEEYYRLFGFEPGGLPPSAEAAFGRVHRDDRPRVDALVREAMERGTPIDAVHRVVWPDGSVHWVRGIAKVFTSDQGEPVRLAGIAMDVTREHEAEAALQASHRQTVEILESISDAFYSLDAEGRFTYVNQIAARLWGQRPENLLGKNLWEVFPSGKETESYKKIQQALADRQPTRYESYSSFLNQWLDIHLYPTAQGLSVYFQDITERKRIEEALRESEARLRALVSASAQVLYRMSPDWQEMRQLQGGSFLTDTEQPNRHWLPEYIHPDDQPWVLEVIGRAVATGRVFELEHRVLRADGSLGWTASRAVPLRDAAGEIVEWFGAASDITERKQAEEALRTAKEAAEQRAGELEAVLNAISDPLVVYDRQGLAVRANPAAEQAYGLDPVGSARETWMPGLDIRDLAGQPVGIDRLPSTRALAGEAVWGERFTYRDARGGVVFVQANASPIRDAEGRPQGAVVIWHDVTERTQAEEALQVREARLRLALEGVPISVAALDRELRYTWVHQPQGGYAPEEILGKRADELLPPEEVAELVALQRAVLESGQPTRQELRLQTRKGWQHFLVNLEPIHDAAGAVQGVRSASYDITELRTLEEEYQQQRTRLEVQRRLTELREQERLQIARDLHDGPLQTLSLLSFELSMAAQMAQDKHLEAALQQAIDTVRELIQELRAFTTELRPPLLVRFGLVKAITAHANAHMARTPSVPILLELGEEFPPLPETVPLTLYRIYQEAFNNILKHSQANQVWVTFGRQDHTATLEVRDNGRGFRLPRQWLDLVREGHLGLVGMRERAEAVGGSLLVHSRPGQGTTLRVRVPAPEAEAERASAD